MKKLFYFIPILIGVFFTSCYDEDVANINNRLDVLEKTHIASLQEQIDAINQSIPQLDKVDKELTAYIQNLQSAEESLQAQIKDTNAKIADVEADLQNEISAAKSELLEELLLLKSELEAEMAQINAAIVALVAKDDALDKKIAELQSYVDNGLSMTQDWASATFATLEQYNALAEEVAVIKTLIEVINANIVDLEVRVNEKIEGDIAVAMSELNATIQEKVKEVTDNYTAAIASVKEDITAAYSTAIVTAVSVLESSMKSWVNDQLAGYYTIAIMDGKLLALQTAITNGNEALQAEIDALKKQLADTKAEVTEAYTKAIEEAIKESNGVIEGKLATAVADINSRIDKELAAINAKIATIEMRLDKVEGDIASINEQIAAITLTIDVLKSTDAELKGYIENLQLVASDLQNQIKEANAKMAEVEKALQGEISTAKSEILAEIALLKSETESELLLINTAIATLNAKDVELEKKITDLQSYIDNELASTKDWASATFATLEQYSAMAEEVAVIKTQIDAINKSIESLENRVNTKIESDIATAVSMLNTTIQEQVKELTDSYMAAINSAKEDITEAYTKAIETAISALESSMKLWVSEQLAGYYTITEIEAIIEALRNDFDAKLSSQKIYLESLISSLSNTLLADIAKNGELIAALRKDLSTLNEEVARNAESIANNAEKISANANNIIVNAQEILANSEQIEANKALIEANTALIAENKQLIADIEFKIDNTSSAINAVAIAENAKAIASNAELIAQNSIALNNNTSAIMENAAEIEKLKSTISSTKDEITQAYTELIEKSINNLDGKLDSSVATINARIDNEVLAINETIDALTDRVSDLEEDVDAIQQQILDILEDITGIKQDVSDLLRRIQSVTYIPKYSDGKATMDYGTKIAELDFLISPKSAVEELATLWNSALSVKAVYTQTRAIEFIDLPIVSFEADNTNGVISLTVSGENLDNNFFVEQQDASAFLQISDGNSHIASDYIAMTPNYNIQFEDPAVKAICCRKWDTNGDAELSYEEAAAVKDIGTVFSENVDIISFSELKYFTGLTHIAAGAFRGVTNLLKVELPKNIAYLGEYAFSGCKNIKNIDCPMFLDSISASAFSGCGKLETINLQSVKNIGDYAFQSCGKLKHITLSHIESIGKYAFSGCVGLEYLYIGNRVAQWGSQAFSDCTGELVCMSSAISEAFKSSKFTKATLAGESYGNDLFRPYGQSPSADAYTLEILILEESVKEIRSLGQRPSIVYCKSLKPPYIYNKPFVLSKIIYVPIGCYDAYIQGKDGWIEYSNIIEEYDFENNPI